MKPINLNRSLFTIAGYDSGSLNALSFIVHQFPLVGVYTVMIRKNDILHHTMKFEVTDASQVRQLDIDLALVAQSQLNIPCHQQSMTSLPTVSPKGYVLFFASNGEGYSARVGGDYDADKAVFNTQHLTSGDIFGLSILEPARYTVANSEGSAKGRIVVTFDEKAAKTLNALQTVSVDVFHDRFEPMEVHLVSTQGLMFHFRDAGRIIVDKETQQKQSGVKRISTRFSRFNLKPDKRK